VFSHISKCSKKKKKNGKLFHPEKVNMLNELDLNNKYKNPHSTVLKVI